MFSTSWKSSRQKRKQVKYKLNAPLHIQQKFMHVHLSKDLIKKHGKRSVQVKKEDKVKILRGQFKGKSGKVERVDIKNEKVYITGIDIIKKEGSNVPQGVKASNLMITELDLDDKKRKQKLTIK